MVKNGMTANQTYFEKMHFFGLLALLSVLHTQSKNTRNLGWSDDLEMLNKSFSQFHLRPKFIS